MVLLAVRQLTALEIVLLVATQHRLLQLVLMRRIALPATLVDMYLQLAVSMLQTAVFVMQDDTVLRENGEVSAQAIVRLVAIHNKVISPVLPRKTVICVTQASMGKPEKPDHSAPDPVLRDATPWPTLPLVQVQKIALRAKLGNTLIQQVVLTRQLASTV